jgi:transcriptional regulator with XRE-family HTH domain
MDQYHPPIWVEFGRRAARRRRILGLTQQVVSTQVGMPRSQLSQLERGVYHGMQFVHLAALARILQTSSDYLLQLVDADPGPVPD